MGKLPLCLIIDIDGTIVGDVSSFHKDMQFRETLTHVTGKNYKRPKQHYVDVLLYKSLLRPHFVEFCQTLSSIASTRPVYVFLSSSGDHAWVHTIAPLIERACNFRFQRPLFTRKHCDDINSKKLSIIRPAINRVLKRNKEPYNSSEIPVIAIDNWDVYLDSVDTPHVLRCPTYDCNVPLDYINDIPISVQHTDAFVHSLLHNKLCNIRKSPDMCKKNMNLATVLSHYYTKLAYEFDTSSPTPTNDKFWLKVQQGLPRLLKDMDKAATECIQQPVACLKDAIKHARNKGT